MSVVVFCNGVLASDCKAYGGRGQPSPGKKRKIHRLDDGTRVGIVSAVIGEPERFLNWLRNGGDPAAWTGDKPDLRAMIVRPNGEVYLADDSVHFSGPIECDRYAIGSGSDYALGALAMGASAEQAVRIASEFDQNSGGEPLTLLPEYIHGA